MRHAVMTGAAGNQFDSCIDIRCRRIAARYPRALHPEDAPPKCAGCWGRAAAVAACSA